MLPAVLMAIAGLCDLLTFDPSHELNPIAATFPAPAAVAKGCLILALALWPWPGRAALCWIAAVAWTVGAVSNLAWRLT